MDDTLRSCREFTALLGSAAPTPGGGGAAALTAAIGTALGVTAGSILPARVVSALSVALFGMFLAIIIPPSKKNPVVLGCVCVSFAASWLCSVLPLTSGLSEGTRTILLTILIASAAAALFHYSKALGIPALVIAALVGFSRLYLFVHFPTDVLVGAVIGVLLAVVSCIVTDKIAARIKSKKAVN